MIVNDPLTWLYLFLLAYGMLTMYWAAKAASAGSSGADYFLASGDVSPWIVAVGVSGMSISGWFVLGFPQSIAAQGFGFGVLTLGGILIALTGVLFLKPQWAIAKRYRLHSQGSMFNHYYGGRALGVISALIAIFIAIGFSGIQLRAVSLFMVELTGEPDYFLFYIWGIAVFLLGYVVIGGMRAIGYISVIQTVLIAASISCLGFWALFATDGFSSLMQHLAILATQQEIASKGMFEVAGVIQFVAGIGVEQPTGSQWTSVMIFSSILALMGIQASPMISHFTISARSPNSIAAGQTWVLAGFFGALLVLFIILIGASGIGDNQNVLSRMVSDISVQSPWFMAIIVIGFVAAVQIVAGMALLAAANSLIRDLYTPFFHSRITEKDQILYARVAILIMLFLSSLLASFDPAILSAIGSAALPVAFQLWPALLGLCWFRFITRQGVLVGLLFGVMGVLFTDTLGIGVLEFLGLDLPWGRWPWTIHSAAWGMFLNLLAVIVISLISQGRGHSENAFEMRQLLSQTVRVNVSNNRVLKPAAWASVLAWLFLAIGPGVVIGNQIFGAPSGGFESWLLQMPSLWAWIILFWALGVFMIWFLAYKMGLASVTGLDIKPIAPVISIISRDNKLHEEELLRLFWVITLIAALITIIAWIFG